MLVYAELKYLTHAENVLPHYEHLIYFPTFLVYFWIVALT